MEITHVQPILRPPPKVHAPGSQAQSSFRWPFFPGERTIVLHQQHVGLPGPVDPSIRNLSFSSSVLAAIRTRPKRPQMQKAARSLLNVYSMRGWARDRDVDDPTAGIIAEVVVVHSEIKLPISRRLESERTSDLERFPRHSDAAQQGPAGKIGCHERNANLAGDTAIGPGTGGRRKLAGQIGVDDPGGRDGHRLSFFQFDSG